MRKIMLRFMVAAVALMLGVVADSLINRLFSRGPLPLDEIAPITLPDSTAQTLPCFPGLSLELVNIRNHGEFSAE